MTRPENPDIVATAGTLGATSAPDTAGDEPMSEKQAVELRELCERKGEPFDGNLTARQAADRIEALRG